MTWVLVFILAAAPLEVQRAPYTSAAACYAAQHQLQGIVASACLERK